MIQLNLLPEDPQHIDPDVVDRSYSVPMSPCPFTGAERFARGLFRKERWRSTDQQCGRNGLPPGTTLIRTALNNGTYQQREVARVDTLPATNGRWKRTCTDVDKAGMLMVWSKCCGPTCCESKAPATKRMTADEWCVELAPMCLACTDYAREMERIEVLRRALRDKEETESVAREDVDIRTPYERARRRKLRSQNRCIQCRSEKSTDDVAFARCRYCRDKITSNWRRNKPSSRREGSRLGLVRLAMARPGPAG